MPSDAVYRLAARVTGCVARLDANCGSEIEELRVESQFLERILKDALRHPCFLQPSTTTKIGGFWLASYLQNEFDDL